MAVDHRRGHPDSEAKAPSSPAHPGPVKPRIDIRRTVAPMDDTLASLLVRVVAAQAAGMLSGAELDAVIASTAEGYSFPTNLDRDPPTDGLAPETQAAFFRRALSEGISPDAFNAHLDQMARVRQA